jgi:uncharacterized membrane protein
VDVPETLISALVTWLLASVVIHLVAKVVMGGSRFVQALLAVLAASVLALLVRFGVQALEWPGWVETVLVLGAFSLGLALIYRKSWLRGALLGFIAWLLWLVVSALVDFLLARF